MQKSGFWKNNLNVLADPTMPGRRSFLAAGLGITAVSLVAPLLLGAEPSQSPDIGSTTRLPQSASVFFTKDISAKGLLEIYAKISMA